MIKALVSKVYHDAEINKTETIKLQAFIVCIVSAICISLDEYFGDSHFTFDFLHQIGLHQSADIYANIVNDKLYSLACWVGVIVLFYGLVPLAIIKFVFKDKFSNYGLGIKGALKDYKIYAIK